MFFLSVCVCVCRSHRQGRASQAVMWVECRVLEAGCGGRRRSLLSTVMRIPCSFWFLLLLGAGSLLLLHLQDLTETLQQQNQGLSNMCLSLLFQFYFLKKVFALLKCFSWLSKYVLHVIASKLSIFIQEILFIMTKYDSQSAWIGSTEIYCNSWMETTDGKHLYFNLKVTNTFFKYI